MKVGTKIKNAAIATAINTALNYLEKDPENNAPKLMDLVDKLCPDDWYVGQRNAIRDVLSNKDSNWFQLVQKIYALDPGVRKAFFTNFITNASLKGSALQEETAKENSNLIPIVGSSAVALTAGVIIGKYGKRILNLFKDVA